MNNSAEEERRLSSVSALSDGSVGDESSVYDYDSILSHEMEEDHIIQASIGRLSPDTVKTGNLQSTKDSSTIDSSFDEGIVNSQISILSSTIFVPRRCSKDLTRLDSNRSRDSLISALTRFDSLRSLMSQKFVTQQNNSDDLIKPLATSPAITPRNSQKWNEYGDIITTDENDFIDAIRDDFDSSMLQRVRQRQQQRIMKKSNNEPLTPDSESSDDDDALDMGLLVTNVPPLSVKGQHTFESLQLSFSTIVSCDNNGFESSQELHEEEDKYAINPDTIPNNKTKRNSYKLRYPNDSIRSICSH